MAKIKIFIFFLIIANVLIAQREIPNDIWKIGTAYTIPKNQIQLSLFYFSKYGLTKNIELQAKPLWYIKLPNFNIKVKWIEQKPKPNKKFWKRFGYALGSISGIYYPTPTLLYFNSKYNFPEIQKTLLLRNEILFSVFDLKNKGCYRKKNIYTLKAGVLYSTAKNFNATLTNNSLLFRKTSVFDKKIIWYFGFDYDSHFNYGIFYSLDIDFFSIGKNVENFVIEHKGLIYTLWLTHTRLALGYKFSFTNKLNVKPAIYPLFDIQIIFYPKKKYRYDQLFENEKRKRKKKNYKDLLEDEKKPKNPPKEKDDEN